MNLRQLRIFKIVCETQNFTKAAGVLYMTQPAVSHVIGELESEIGFQLFDRLSRKIYLTQAGKIFLDKSTRILELYDDLKNQAGGIAETAPLRIGSTITIANVWLPRIMETFQKRNNKCVVKVEVGSAENTEKKLRENKIDLALIEGMIAGNQYEKIVFSSYEMVLICSPSHKWAGKTEIPLKDILEEKFLLREKGSALRNSFDSALLLHNIIVDPIWVSVNSQALVQAVSRNLGVSVMPVELVERELQNGEIAGVRIRNMKLVNQNHIVYHKDKYLSHSAHELIELIQHHNNKQIEL